PRFVDYAKLSRGEILKREIGMLREDKNGVSEKWPACAGALIQGNHGHKSYHDRDSCYAAAQAPYFVCAGMKSIHLFDSETWRTAFAVHASGLKTKTLREGKRFGCGSSIEIP